MDKEKGLEKKLEEFQEYARENKKVDLATLAINALESQTKNLVSSKQKKWAYLVSVGLPPFGLLFALKFYFYDPNKDDAKRVALICVILTGASLILFLLVSQLLFSSAGLNMNQIQQINPKDIQDLIR